MEQSTECVANKLANPPKNVNRCAGAKSCPDISTALDEEKLLTWVRLSSKNSDTLGFLMVFLEGVRLSSGPSGLAYDIRPSA
jgi:hypothetical protein